MSGMIRQGDILLRPTTKVVKGTPDAGENGRTVIARGEQSGHSHSLPLPAAVLYRDSDGSAMLEVKTDTKLQHLFGLKDPTGEHGDLNVPAGNYDVLQQHGVSPEQTPDTRVWD